MEQNRIAPVLHSNTTICYFPGEQVRLPAVRITFDQHILQTYISFDYFCEDT